MILQPKMADLPLPITFKKILLASDNDAFNRLYEFLGQEYINNSLRKMGYKDVQIIHRLDISLTEQQNRRTNPVRFIDSSSNRGLRTGRSEEQARNTQSGIQIGKGFHQGR